VFPPNEAPTSVTITSWKSNYNNGWSNVTMVMTYKYSRQDVEVNIGFHSAGARNILTMIYVKPITGGMPPAPTVNPPAPQPQTPPPQEQPQQPQEQQNDDKSNSL
jgi:hypothetical protein